MRPLLPTRGVLFDLDVTLVRVLWILLTIFPPLLPGIVAYLVCCFAMPQLRQAIATSPSSSTSGERAAAIRRASAGACFSTVSNAEGGQSSRPGTTRVKCIGIRSRERAECNTRTGHLFQTVCGTLARSGARSRGKDSVQGTTVIRNRGA